MTSVSEGGVVCEPLDCTYLSPEFQRKAKKELNEEPDRRSCDIQELREMMSDLELDVSPSDSFLLKFLRARKFNKEKSLKLLRQYYAFNKDYNHVLTPRKPSLLAHVFHLNALDVLPQRTPEGSAVVIVRFGHIDMTVAPFDDGLKAVLLSLEKAIEYEATQINGCVIIYDMDGLSWTHINQLIIPRNMRMAMALQQDCFPIRLKEIHVIFESFFVDVLYSFAKPFLKEKMKKRMYFHGNDVASLHCYVPPDILPSEYGGVLGPFNNSSWFSKLLTDEDPVSYKVEFNTKV